jgi:hypothetical protein
MDEHYDRLQSWLSSCAAGRAVRLIAARSLRSKAEREVWDCTVRIDGRKADAILTIFKPGFLETVNTSLPPEETSEKCFLAMSELPALGIPTPVVLGHAAADGEAALLHKRVDRTGWEPETRVAAARILAGLHNLQEHRLSLRLRELVRFSDPREYRTTGGNGPTGANRTLVHGDYFSRNILRVSGGLCVIDWETLGWGSPMWDLGFLIGADPGLADEEIETVVAEYQSHAAVNLPELTWHRERWADFWRERECRSSMRARTDATYGCVTDHKPGHHHYTKERAGDEPDQCSAPQD